MCSWRTIVCSFCCTFWILVCSDLLNFVNCGGPPQDISCPWPAFNCRVSRNVKSFALSRELRASALMLPRECSNLEWTCSNGECIPASSRCNAISECGDGSDEISCQGVGLGPLEAQMKASRRLSFIDIAPQTSTNMDNCTVHVSPAHERFCSRRYRGYYRHPFNCERYIVCEWGNYYECQCPSLTRWDMRIVACIWKFMAPCLSRDRPTGDLTSPTHPSKIARLIELLTKAKSEFDKRRKEQMTGKVGFITPGVREISQNLSERTGIPVNVNNRVISPVDPMYNGRNSNFGRLV